MGLNVIVGEIEEAGLMVSFDVLFSEKMHLRDALNFFADEYQYVAERTVVQEVHHERDSSLGENCLYSPTLCISPIGNLDFGKTDYFLIEAGGSFSVRERLQKFRNHLNQKYL